MLEHMQQKCACFSYAGIDFKMVFPVFFPQEKGRFVYFKTKQTPVGLCEEMKSSMRLMLLIIWKVINSLFALDVLYPALETSFTLLKTSSLFRTRHRTSIKYLFQVSKKCTLY